MSDPELPDAVVLRVERTFNASREVVFDAWTSSDVLIRWWRPGPDWETPVAEADGRVGGHLRIVMRGPDGEEIGGGGQYIEVTPPERLVFTWIWDGQEDHAGSQLVEVEFNQQTDGTTTVVVTNRGLRDEEDRQSHRYGWQGSLDNLERVLAACPLDQAAPFRVAGSRLPCSAPPSSWSSSTARSSTSPCRASTRISASRTRVFNG